MKRLITLLMFSVLLLSFTGCGVAQNDYDTVVAEQDKLQAEYDQQKADYESLKAEYDKLLTDTADWRKLLDEEKTAQIAQAEADRIVAEEAAKKAAEEQAAADAAAKKAAEEKAAADAKKAAAERIVGGIEFPAFPLTINGLTFTKVEVTQQNGRAYVYVYVKNDTGKEINAYPSIIAYDKDGVQLSSDIMGVQNLQDGATAKVSGYIMPAGTVKVEFTYDH
ncbi:MAG: hypothetical protein LBT26_07470 [Clostridiales Family XIII bacterium]|jgi:hypothetical protein|nr:hypothetical protein [Clostridiales Family XIII bacterium]